MAAIAPIRIIVFLLVAACCALGQESGKPGSLPDAPSSQALSNQVPSTQAPSRTEIFQSFENAVRSPAVSPARPSGPYAAPFNFGDVRFTEHPAQNESGNIFEKYLSPAAVKESRSYHPSNNGSFMSRVSYATSGILIKQDETGRKSLNTSYLLAVLTTAAAHSARSPSWRRTASQPFSDFGSTVGNDAGMNLLHEFGIRGLVKNHEPRFISRIEEHIRR